MLTRAADQREDADEPSRLRLQTGWLGFQRAQRLADPADLARDAGRHDFADA